MSQIGRVVACFGLLNGIWCSPALAADPLNSNNRPNEEHQPITEVPDARNTDDGAAHTDFNLVPVVGGSTDLGLGGGYFAGLARNKKGYDPFLWNIDSSALITFKHTVSGGFTVPYQDIYARLTIPRLFGAALRLEIRPSYTWETIDYWGLGNASSTAAPANSPHGYFTYQRGHPQFDVDMRGKIADHFSGRVGFRYIQNIIKVASDSKLAQDQRDGSDEVKRLIGPLRSHAVVLFKYGLQLDTRDNETSSHSGTFDTLDLKLSPGGTEEFPYRYGEATLNVRGFMPLSKPALTLAVRAVGDYMFGNVPFYELARFDDTFALGGTTGVRGVPAGRYYGKVKAFGNVELRAELFTFRALGKAVIFAVVPFFDAGRLWADTTAQPALDGRGAGLKYGTGGGIRLQSGSSFVIHADLAWSPDATPISGDLRLGRCFRARPAARGEFAHFRRDVCGLHFTRSIDMQGTRIEQGASLALGLVCVLAAAYGCAADQGPPPHAPVNTAFSAPAHGPTGDAGSGAASAVTAPGTPRDPADPATAFDPPAELRLPSALKSGERVPLLMVLHGFGVSSSLLIAKAALNQVADAKRFAYLAPEGTRDSRGRTFWNAGPSCCDLEHQAPDDVKRLRELLDFNLKNPAVDPARVFLVGYSNGGFMAHRLACDLSDRLAGIISVAGAASGPEVPCTPMTPLSVLEIHGDADPVVHYQGGVVFDRTDLPPHPSAVDTVKIWAQRLGCAGALHDVGSADLEPYIAGSETGMQRYEGCRGTVELWTVHGGGHYVALQPPALEAMWSFMLAHPKSGA